MDYLGSFLALGVILAGILAVVLVFLRRLASHGLDEGQQRLLATKYVIFNSLYTFFLSLAVVTLLASYNQAKNAVHQEAERLLFTHRVSHNLAAAQPFRDALTRYTQSIVEDEWPLLADKTLSSTTGKYSGDLWKSLNALDPADAKQTAVFQEIVRELSEASKSRIARTLFAKGHLFPFLWVVIGTGFCLCFVQFFHTSLPQKGVQAAYDFVVLTMLAMVILVLYSLDHPFEGLARISPMPFQNALEAMKALP